MDHCDIVFDDLYISAKNRGLIDWLKWYYRENGLPVEQMKCDIIEAFFPAYGQMPFSKLVIAYALDMLDLWTERECGIANDNGKFCGWSSDLSNRFSIDGISPTQQEHIKARLGQIRISHLPFGRWPNVRCYHGWQHDGLVSLHQTQH